MRHTKEELKSTLNLNMKKLIQNNKSDDGVTSVNLFDNYSSNKLTSATRTPNTKSFTKTAFLNLDQLNYRNLLLPSENLYSEDKR